METFKSRPLGYFHIMNQDLKLLWNLYNTRRWSWARQE